MNKILIVDDEPSLLLLLKSRLEANHYQVLTACHGIEGLQVLKQERPDLVLLDILMPDIDGFSFLEKMKQFPDVRSVPIIMLSAKARQEDIRRAISLGAKDYVIKPFTPEILMNKIKKVLQKN